MRNFVKIATIACSILCAGTLVAQTCESLLPYNSTQMFVNFELESGCLPNLDFRNLENQTLGNATQHGCRMGHDLGGSLVFANGKLLVNDCAGNLIAVIGGSRVANGIAVAYVVTNALTNMDEAFVFEAAQSDGYMLVVDDHFLPSATAVKVYSGGNLESWMLSANLLALPLSQDPRIVSALLLLKYLRNSKNSHATSGQFFENAGPRDIGFWLPMTAVAFCSATCLCMLARSALRPDIKVMATIAAASVTASVATVARKLHDIPARLSGFMRFHDVTQSAQAGGV